MWLSEFWDALDEVYGPSLGRSLAQDLYLPAPIGATAAEALDRGDEPDDVWAAFVVETGREDARWVHRRAKKGRK